MTPSVEPDTIHCPFRENATEQIFGFRTRKVPSAAPDTIFHPSGEKNLKTKLTVSLPIDRNRQETELTIPHSHNNFLYSLAVPPLTTRQILHLPSPSLRPMSLWVESSQALAVRSECKVC
jgi:hypothetical protein